MSASRHMVRVMRSAGAADARSTPMLSQRTRTILLACLTIGVVYLFAVYTLPELPHLIAMVQRQTSLQQFVGP